MEDSRSRRRKAGRVVGIGSSIYGIVFLIIWCTIAAGMGAWFMLIFGIPVLGLMIFRLFYLLCKTKEPPKEPWEQPDRENRSQPRSAGNGFCPHCGRALDENFTFCPHCGRRQG